jgi:flagellar biosynthesis GTPase FlhF
MSGFAHLLERIEEFIRKFYLNRLIRGGLLFLALTIGAFLLFVNIEYFALLSSGMRAFLFFSFLFIVAGSFWFFILNPLLKINKVGRRLSYEEASKMIGSLIPGIEDKVLNTLQLSGFRDNSLALAAIEQKSIELTRNPFSSAIDLKQNKRFLWFVLPVVLVLLGILLANPKIITTGSDRILNYNTAFLPEAPFDFVLLNDLNAVEEGSDVDLRLKLKGDDIPAKVFVQSNYGRFMMTEVGKNEYSFVVPKLRENLKFHFVAADFNSGSFELPVYGSSVLAGLNVELIYPGYLSRPNEIIENPVMLVVPQGTKVRFKGVLKNAEEVSVKFVDSVFSSPSGINCSYRFMASQEVVFKWKNKFSGDPLSLEKRVDIIPDLYPTIEMKRSADSTNARLFFFNGEVRDDYGVGQVNFVLETRAADGKFNATRIPIPAMPRGGGVFYHMLDINNLGLKAGDVLNYYFEVYDNDGVNGPKRSLSARYEFRIPDAEELAEQRTDALQNAQAGVSDIQKEMQRFQQSMDEFRKANLNRNTPAWKKQEMLERLQLQQMQLEQMMQNELQNLNETIQDQERFDEVDEELLKKQEELNKLFEELMDDELRELLEKMQEMMQENNQMQLEELMKDQELTNEQMMNQIDRSMEMLKRMEVEERLDKALSELDDLQKRQEELSNKMDANEQELQDKLNEDFQKLMDELKEIEEKNDDLKKPMDLDFLEELQDDIEQDMNDAQENLEKGNADKANDPQKDAADKIKQMKDNMQAQSDAQKKEEKGEDIETLRSILFNLMRLSFDQERVMLEMQLTQVSDPSYTKLTREQRKIMDDHVVVRDSLIALVERVPELGSIVDQELKVIALNFRNVTPHMHERKTRETGVNQQYVMTSYNNLALMLNEALEQMQMQMQGMEGGGGSCDNPGGKGKKPGEGMGNMKDMLKKQMEQMKNGMNPGGKEGGQNPGGSGAPVGQGVPMPVPGMNAGEVARMAAEQAMMRRALEEMRNELNRDGSGSGDVLNPLIDELDKQERDLVNGNHQNLIKRQQDIMTRLLESEKALRERELDETRQSTPAKDDHQCNLTRFDEYKKQKEREVEQLRLQTPGLNAYYRQMALQYYNRVLSN